MKKARWFIVLTLVAGLLMGPLVSHVGAVSSGGGGTGSGGSGDMPTVR